MWRKHAHSLFTSASKPLTEDKKAKSYIAFNMHTSSSSY